VNNISYFRRKKTKMAVALPIEEEDFELDDDYDDIK
jgi:hypothetical protein